MCNDFIDFDVIQDESDEDYFPIMDDEKEFAQKSIVSFDNFNGYDNNIDLNPIAFTGDDYSVNIKF